MHCLKKNKNLYEQKQKEIKPQIEKLMLHSNMFTENCQVQMITRKGNVDYSKIPELKNINLEKYRKKETRYLQVKMKNETNESVD